MIKTWDIPGGVHPPENKTQSNNTPIASISLPDEIVLPLNQHIGSSALPIVNVGDQVLKGQRIADAQGLVSAPVHASTSGTITAIEDRVIPHASGLSASCIVISPDKNEQWCELTPCEDYTSQPKLELIQKIRESGIAGLGGAGFPTAVKLSPHANQKIDTLIINGTECEPYITADDRLMRERAEEIVAGIQLLSYLLDKPATIIVGIEDNKPEAIDAMETAVQEAELTGHIEVASFPTKYPSGGEKQLVQILTGKEVPSGGIPAQIGIVVQNVGTALASYRAVRYGEPLVSRVTTIVGESLQQQGNVDVLIGTPIDHILRERGFADEDCARLIIGGPMMGYAMGRTDIPLIKTTNCVLVPSAEEMPDPDPAQACIRCGMCAEVCPASLLPQQLYWHSRAEDIDKLQSHNLFDCIECGACSFVCPSNIPLVQYYRASKGIIRRIEDDKHKSDRSRLRFEFRQERIAKAEAAKEAKRLARKKAAEEAKRQLADKPASASPVNTPPTAAKTDDPALHRGKLERAVSSAKSRVERAQSQLQKAHDEGEQTRVESLESRLKQATLKLTEAQEKLTQFDQEGGAAPAPASLIKEKLSLSEREKAEKSIATLKKRIDTAEQKYAEAQQSGAATAGALQTGVEKLTRKLQDAEQALIALDDHASNQEGSTNKQEKNKEENQETLNAADAAIAKAQEKASQMANMSDEEKAQAQLTAMKKRLEKARSRLKTAEAENNEHIDAFRNSVTKLETKIKEAEENS